MTAFLLLYYALLVLWLPLLWPALQLYGWKRGWLLAVAGAGLLAAVNEVWQTVWAVNAIRLDALLFSVVLTLLYASAVGVLYGAFRRRFAVVLGVALALIAGGMTYQWTMAGREGKRLTAAFDARNALLFRAKFRMFPSSCHEGNYSLANILSGQRVADIRRVEAFKPSDANGDGKLSKDEYKVLLTTLGFANQLETLFGQRDVNKDGFVTAEEYRNPLPQ